MMMLLATIASFWGLGYLLVLFFRIAQAGENDFYTDTDYNEEDYDVDQS